MKGTFSLQLMILLALLLMGPGRLSAQQQFQGACSTVKIAIEQELTTERIGFEATLKVTNNDGADPITNFSAALTFRDPETGEDASDKFFVQPPELENVNEIDGDGIIGPTKQAIVRWFIIPKIAAGGTDPRGTEYAVGCDLAGRMQGEIIPEDVMFAIEDTITVKPEAQLQIRYFQPRDVQGDDPFTPEVESPIPFTLGVMVTNAGYGKANKVKINSKQPKIVENLNGLLLVARLLGASVQDERLDEASLLVDLGDIEPGDTRKGTWSMITSLSGEFIEFKASYTHADELGGEETSIITLLEAHFISHEVLNDEPGRDAILDFLADVDRDAEILPDTLYESDGTILPVNHQTTTSVSGSVGANNVTVDIVAEFEGWVYMRLDDPGQAKFGIRQVVRSDGKVLDPNNVWTNIRYRESDNFKLTYLNIFDRVENGQSYSYAVEYAPPAVDNVPPETTIRFAGESSEVGGVYYIDANTQIYFTSVDDSPVSIEYQVNAGGFGPALPFTLDVPGTYAIDYFATDLAGNVESTKSATVVIPGADSMVALNLDESAIFPAEILSTRPATATISALVPANALQVDGQLKIFQGVVAWANVSGVPASPTPLDTATLGVGGQFVDFYKFRVNGGSWSGDTPVADPIVLSGLAGAVAVDVLGRPALGSYLDETNATQVSWVVDPAAPDLQVAGVPATPSNDAFDVNLNLTDPSAALYRWTIADGYYRAEEPLSTPIVLERMAEASHTVKVIGRRGGVWQNMADASEIRWSYDRAYGFDFSMLDCVRTVEFPDTAGQAISFEWDGKDDSGVPQIPGPYTLFLTLTDSLGNVTRSASLLQIQGVSTQQIVLADSATGVKNLRVRGNWAVWQQNETGIWNIWARDLSNPDPVAGTVQVTSDTEFQQENPATDGKYVVWQGRRDNGSADIFWANLNTLQSGALTDTGSESEVNPDIDWPWVAYQRKINDNPIVPWFIQAANLDTGQSFLVSFGAGDQFRPRLHAGRVVWEDHRDVGPGEIYFADLEEGTSRRITNDLYGQNNPVIFGDLIAWQDNRNAQVDIWLHDLRKGSEEQVTDTAFNETNPFLAGEWLVCQEDSLGAGTAENIHLVDLQTRGELSLTKTGRIHENGALGNGFAVWVEHLGGGGRRAVASLLPGLQPVMSHANALAVTPDLAGRFNSAFALLNDWGPAADVSSVTHYDSFSPLNAQTATYAGGSASGSDFPLAAGTFLWIEFGAKNMVDLGSGDGTTVDFAAGFNAFSYTGFPLGFTAYAMIDSLGAANVGALRYFDAFAGQWRSVEPGPGGEKIGPDFALPRVSTILLNMTNPVNGWKP